MIQKAVFSYINRDNDFRNAAGFHSFADFLYTTALAVLCASKQFKKVEMVTDDWAVDMFREMGFPITDYNNKLNELQQSDFTRFFWAYGKILAYCEQNEPFVHLDNDVMIWEQFPERILNARLCFQSTEPFKLHGYHYYKLLKPMWKEAPVRPQQIVDHEVKDYAYNCGICGGYDLEFFKEWEECSRKYIFAPENMDLFYGKYARVLVHQNLFHEQYFAASLIKGKKLRKEVEVLAPDVIAIPKIMKYTHIWGTTKRDFTMMRKVFLRLQKEDEGLHSRIGRFVMKHNLLK